MPLAYKTSANALIINGAGTALCENCCEGGVCHEKCPSQFQFDITGKAEINGIYVADFLFEADFDSDSDHSCFNADPQCAWFSNPPGLSCGGNPIEDFGLALRETAPDVWNVVFRINYFTVAFPEMRHWRRTFNGLCTDIDITFTSANYCGIDTPFCNHGTAVIRVRAL
jgi:hypothetical protein